MIRAVAIAIAVSTSAGAHALQVRDDRGVTVTLERPAERIVALAPHLAEIAFAAGAGAKLIGVSTFSRHPPEAERLPVVASYGRVDVERLIALRPQLVLAWQSGNSPLQIERLERLALPVFVTETRSLADIPRIVRLVGALAGSTASAEARARRLEDEIEELRRRHAGERDIAVFLEIWHAPMLTVNGGPGISRATHYAYAAGATFLPGRRPLLPWSRASSCSRRGPTRSSPRASAPTRRAHGAASRRSKPFAVAGSIRSTPILYTGRARTFSRACAPCATGSSSSGTSLDADRRRTAALQRARGCRAIHRARARRARRTRPRRDRAGAGVDRRSRQRDPLRSVLPRPDVARLELRARGLPRGCEGIIRPGAIARAHRLLRHLSRGRRRARTMAGQSALRARPARPRRSRPALACAP